MTIVMFDNDITGYRELFEGALRNQGWEEYELVRLITLAEEGLAGNTADRDIWRYCQRKGIILLTANRNQDDPNSLQQTLLEENTESSLPVVTVGDKARLGEQEYRERCVESLVGILINLDNLFGSGRQFIP